MYAMIDTEKITIASVISRTAAPDRSMAKKCCDGLLKDTPLDNEVWQKDLTFP